MSQIIPSFNFKKPITLCWLRRDLRLHDHHALYQALKDEEDVLPLFIFDREILDKLSNKEDARVNFIHNELAGLHAQLKTMGSSLLIVEGNPLDIFVQLKKRYQLKAIYTNEDYEPYATDRDRKVRGFLTTQGVPFRTFKDQVIFSPNEVLKKDGTPYTVYTPYRKEWEARYHPSMVSSFDVKQYQAHLIRIAPLPFPTLESLGFLSTSMVLPSKKWDVKLLKEYAMNRDKLGTKGTSHLGMHLRFGTISIREATHMASLHSSTWLQQLIWRNFFMMILSHFPHVVHSAFKPAYDQIPWRADTKGFKAWCEGKTGYPIVDAGMRELNATGFMHNRARMITASFLTKLLLIDWRLGEAYFAEKLLDYELAANNGNWQWAAGTGCDAAPYFRIFSPERQTQRFDPLLQYIKKWVPEYGSSQYPKPIVEYAFARKRALETYQEALKKFR